MLPDSNADPSESAYRLDSRWSRASVAVGHQSHQCMCLMSRAMSNRAHKQGSVYRRRVSRGLRVSVLSIYRQECNRHSRHLACTLKKIPNNLYKIKNGISIKSVKLLIKFFAPLWEKFINILLYNFWNFVLYYSV